MIKKYIPFLLFLFCTAAFGQTVDVGLANSHEQFVSLLKNSKDNYYGKILEQYDDYILKNPTNINAQIERCKFIGNAYYDEYEDYDTNYQETGKCTDVLYESYPEHPDVLIYRANNIYGDERSTILQKGLELMNDHPNSWSDVQKAELYQLLGYQNSENNKLALEYFEKALDLNDDLDLSINLANAYFDLGRKEQAREVLLKNLEKDTLLWNINQKADLLLKLEEPAKALELYEIIEKRDSSYINNAEMAAAMSGLGNFEIARKYLVKDTITEWNKLGKLQNLFKHDYQYSSAEVALATYRSAQKLSSYDDMLAVKRIRLFFKNPLMGWNLSELLHLVLFAIAVLLLFLIPYLWILPIYAIGEVLKRKGIQITSSLTNGWTFRHFWVISFLYLLVQFLVIIIFYYEDYLNTFFDLITTYDNEAESDISIANSVIVFVVLMAVFTTCLLYKKKYKATAFQHFKAKANVRICDFVLCF